MNPNWSGFRAGLADSAAWLRVSATAPAGLVALVASTLAAGIDTPEQFAELAGFWGDIVSRVGLPEWDRIELNTLLSANFIPLAIDASGQLQPV